MFALVLALTGCKDDPDPTGTITFNANRGSGAVPAITAVLGSNITLPSGDALSRGGYDFGGWNTNPGGTGTNYNGGEPYTLTANATLYAKWVSAGIDVTRTITFDINGGSGTAPEPKTANALTSITLPDGSGLSRSGYTFGGWNTAEDGTGTNYSGGASYMVNDHATLYANWVFTVTFDNNGGGVAPYPRVVAPGSSVALPSTTRPGFTFVNWNTSILGTGDTYEADEDFTPAANITLYAQWKDVYTIVFDANGNEGAVNGRAPVPLQVTTGNSVTIPGNETLAIAYASFTGWNTEPDGTGDAHATGSSYTPTGSITLYAQWSVTTPFASVTGGLGNQLLWIQAHAEDNAIYTVTADANITIEPKIFSGSNVTIKLSGTYVNNGTISFSSIDEQIIKGTLFTLNPGVTLELGNYITLKGYQLNNDSLVKVMGGTLVMNGGAITENCYQSGIINVYQIKGGGVYVGDGGTFTMTGGTISHNYASTNGGGVYVDAGGTFTMTGGTITYNTAQNCLGGGVYVFGSPYGYVPGNFTKTGGTITGYSSGDNMSFNYCWHGYPPPGIRENSGHAIYIWRGSGSALRRETTAGPSDNLSFVNGVASAGWE
jgi:uncharacterized repeat protein (TIGR02543 family)